MNARVLVVAGKASLRAAIVQIVRSGGHTVEAAATEDGARAALAGESIDAVILAPPSADRRGLALARALRRSVSSLILVAERDDDGRRLAKLLPATPVCVWPPADEREFLACLGPATARSKAAGKEMGGSIVRFDGATVDLGAHTYVDAGGRERQLTRTQLALLSAFLRSPGRVLSRDHLRQVIGGRDSEPYDRSIDMLVARLRRKIEPDQGAPRLILTVAGSGYKLALRPRSIKWTNEAAQSAEHRGEPDRLRRPVERRLLTVMACQIAGFGRLSSQRDPEDLRDALETIRTECLRVLAPFDGRLVHLLGANLLIYFGYAEAREDDVERAILAGLDLVRAIGGLRESLSGALRLRVGIATGPVVVESGVPEAYGAVGGPLNLAMRLQSAAAADHIVISEETHAQAGASFKYRKLRAVVIEKGMRPVPAWRVETVDEAAGRFDAVQRAGMTEFVARAQELERLRRNWSKAYAKSGCVVLLTGEAGIGKSRLAAAFEQASAPKTILRFFGSARRKDASLFTIINELERAAGFGSQDAGSARSSKLDALLAHCGGRAREGAATIAQLMGLPVDPGTVEWTSPERVKQQAFGALLARIEHLASLHPVLVRIEDAQWIDPTSLDFLRTLVEQVSRLRVMVIVTARPEFTSPWSGLPHASVMTVARLARHDAEALVAHAVGGNALPRDVTSEILARADGIPLFLEEIAKAVLEGGLVRPRGERHDRAGTRVSEVPKTLQASLLARLDRLGPGKEIAQIGAAIGREFAHALLTIVAARPETELAAALDPLVASGLLFRRGVPPYATYAFKHALVRDAAYHMLVRPRRQQLHARIADALERRFPETCSGQPEVLAHHCREGGYTAKAIAYLTAAAEYAQLRSGTSEAFAQLTQAQDLLSTLPDDRERSQLELKVEIVMGRLLTARRSYAAPETREAYRRARLRCEASGNQALLPLIILGQCVGAWSAADHRLALKEAQDLYSCGERNGAPNVSAVALMMLGMSSALLGELLSARHHFEQALHINSFALPPRGPFLFSDADGRISSLTYLHDLLLLLGYPEQADKLAERAQSVAAETDTASLGQSYSRALALNHTLRMYVFRGDVERTASVGAALLRLSREQGYPYFVGTATIYTGWALAHAGDAVRGIEHCDQGIAQLRSIGANCWLPRYYALLAECCEKAGDFERGGQAVTSALQSLETTRERIWEGDIYRLKGQFLLHARNSEQAETYFRKALRVAHRQQARLLELRAATSLAGLLAQDGRSDKAAVVLAKAYAWFTEGFDQSDLQHAKAVLEALPTRASPGNQVI